MQTLTLAGHETTASTLSWLLWELAKNPAYQLRMRAEIQAARAAISAREVAKFTIDDLDAMTTVVNAIKARTSLSMPRFSCFSRYAQETLRFHPILPMLSRVASRDDIIPLSQPVLSTTGDVVNAVPIRAGQWIYLSLCAYNR